VRDFFHSVGIHSTTIQYEQQDDLINNNKENNVSKLTQNDCLLSCPDEVCGTKTCCTKDSIRTNAVLNITTNDTTHKKPVDAIETCIKMESEALHTHDIDHNTSTQSSEKDSLLKSD
jgi:hypothetical protein